MQVSPDDDDDNKCFMVKTPTQLRRQKRDISWQAELNTGTDQ